MACLGCRHSLNSLNHRSTTDDAPVAALYVHSSWEYRAIATCESLSCSEAGPSSALSVCFQHSSRVGPAWPHHPMPPHMKRSIVSTCLSNLAHPPTSPPGPPTIPMKAFNPLLFLPLRLILQGPRALCPQPGPELVQQEPGVREVTTFEHAAPRGPRPVSVESTYGMGMNRTVKKPRRLFPQSMPRLTNSPCAASGMPAPIILRKKSFDARTEAAYSG